MSKPIIKDNKTQFVSRRHFIKLFFYSIFLVIASIPPYSFLIDRLWVETTKIQLTKQRLPKAFSGLKIVQMSDIHLGFHYTYKNFSALIKRINNLKPDLICFTGDLVDDQVDGLAKMTPLLKSLKAPLGKVAIFGNHDYRSGKPYQVEQALVEGGFTFLKNRNTTIERNWSRIHIAGLDDLFGGQPNIEKAMSGIPKNEFTLLLAHEPDLADQALNYPIDMQLSGHSHGGQVRLPFYGALYRPDGAKKYVEGLKQLPNDLSLYVNRGIGTTVLPLRFNCRPEITLFTLHSST